jgi:hypothetical protein
MGRRVGGYALTRWLSIENGNQQKIWCEVCGFGEDFPCMQSKLATPLNLCARKEPDGLADIGGAELRRIVDAFAAAIQGRGGGTFQIVHGLNLGAGWQRWFESVFLPAIRPAFAGSHEAIRVGRYHEIVAINAELEKFLSAGEVCRALAAGRVAWQEIAVPQRQKLDAEIFQSTSRILLPTVFAIHTALFHLPNVQALQGYLWLEAILTAGLCAPGELSDLWYQVTASCAAGIPFHATFAIS